MPFCWFCHALAHLLWILFVLTDVFVYLYGLYEIGHEMRQLMRFWYLSHRRPAKAQASLRIRAVSPEPSLFAHMNYGSRRSVRQKIGHLAPLDGCACEFEEWIYGGQKVPKSHELAQIFSTAIPPPPPNSLVGSNPRFSRMGGRFVNYCRLCFSDSPVFKQ